MKVVHICWLLVITCSLTVSAQQFKLVDRGHSHNDYTRKHPLTDALENGFMSVEVDVFLKKGDLKVAHTKLGIRKRKTLTHMYLEPLMAQYRELGKIYHGTNSELILMVDLKEGGEAIMQALDRVLSSYKQLLTYYADGEKIPGLVRVVLSGDGIKYTAGNYAPRYFSIDGSLQDIQKDISSDLLPRVSANYNSVFTWKGNGPMPEEERAMLYEYVQRAHYHGRKIRFWALPHNELVWEEMLEAGVDWINVDDLPAFREYYLNWLKTKP